MKIRLKLTILPIIAILLPLLGAILYARHVAWGYYEKQIGTLYLTIAENMGTMLRRDVMGEAQTLEQFVRYFSVVERLDALPQTALDPAAIERIEAEWPNLGPDDEPLRSALNNPLAKELIRFQKVHPLFAELILTDSRGRLVAATNPTTDYLQSDERWWEEAAQADTAKGWTHDIAYDASAGVQAMDIVMPVRNASGELRGVLKGSLDAAAVLYQLAPEPWNAEVVRDILFPDGRLFARINPVSDVGPQPGHVSMAALEQFRNNEKTWEVVRIYGNRKSLAACVPVVDASDDDSAEGICVLVHRDYAAAMAPVVRVIRELTWQGSLFVVVIAAFSYVLASTWFARPLRKLRRAANGIIEHVRAHEDEHGNAVRHSLRSVEDSLHKLGSIRTRDEMQDLAEVFAQMGRRVLNFHHRLSDELARKTEEINEDLVMAREFQEALLPDRYPRVEAAGSHCFNLGFSHIYRPAQSVSGDFFDISEVSKHCVRIVVADVMGHGARSALMTAILHALIYDTSRQDDDPAHLLQRMNEEFHAIGQRVGETIFVTAVHLLIDTRRCIVHYAAAGHPSPLIIDHESAAVCPLIPEEQASPAAGLIPDAQYASAEYALEKEQTLLLYTDGAIEAENPQREEFGVDRLVRTVREGIATDRSLPEYLIASLEAFMDTAVAMDDICLVSIDITRS